MNRPFITKSNFSVWPKIAYRIQFVDIALMSKIALALYCIHSSKVWSTNYVCTRWKWIDSSWAVSKLSTNVELETDISRNVHFQLYYTYRSITWEKQVVWKQKSIVVLNKSSVRRWCKKLDFDVLLWMVSLCIDVTNVAVFIGNSVHNQLMLHMACL